MSYILNLINLQTFFTRLISLSLVAVSVLLLLNIMDNNGDVNKWLWNVLYVVTVVNVISVAFICAWR